MQSFSQTLPINELIGGRYRIQSILGEGGFGITYKAWDEKLKREVVIKEYLPDEVGARDANTRTVIPRTHREENFRYGLTRYLEEAVTLARFKHPHIVQVHDYFEANGTAYIVMDFEEGETLAERIKSQGGVLPEAEILAILLPLLDGLRQVHREGLLHRDIKPGNIFLRKEGGPLLIDFGSARHALGEQSKSLSAIISQGYAPPEQYSTRGKQGAFSDLYAIGAVLYQLITGEAPIESVNRSHEIMSGEPDPLVPATVAGRGKVSPWLLELTDRLLIIPFKERPQSCDEVIEFIQGQGVQKAAPSKPASGRRSVLGSDPGERTGQGRTRVVAETDRFGVVPPVAGNKRGWIIAGTAAVLLVAGAAVALLLSKGGPEGTSSPKVTAGPGAAPDMPSGIGARPPVPPLATAPPVTPIPTTPPEPAPPVTPDTAPTQPPIIPIPEPEPPVAPTTGQLQVSVNVPNAVVKVDGVLVGRAAPGSPLKREGLNKGEHRIEVSAEGFPPWQGRAGVRPGEWTRVAVEFDAMAKQEDPVEPPVSPPADRGALFTECERYAEQDGVSLEGRRQYMRECIASLSKRREGGSRPNGETSGVRARCEQYARQDGIRSAGWERYIRECMASLSR